MWPGPMPICMPSFILIRPTVWPEYTNVTDRNGQDKQTGQLSDSVGRTVLQTVAQNTYVIEHAIIFSSCGFFLLLSFFLWSPYGIGQTIIFLPCGFFLLSFFLSIFPRLISSVGDWMYTMLPHSTHGVALA